MEKSAKKARKGSFYQYLEISSGLRDFVGKEELWKA